MLDGIGCENWKPRNPADENFPSEYDSGKDRHMQRIVIFGNSGSGKSTLAHKLAKSSACAVLDLDTIAWKKDTDAPLRMDLAQSNSLIEKFMATNNSWVIEGCYADLLELVLPHSREIVFLNPPIDTCLENCRNRPWEQHKYDSPEKQDANLKMLLAWVEQYPQRSDEFSLKAHQQIFENYSGKKREYKSNER